MYYTYIYLDTRKLGLYSYDNYIFEYEPFYVGKGKEGRAYSHLRIAKEKRKGKINLFISKIRSILNDGYEPIILKIKDNISEQESLNLEFILIKIIGRLCQNSGPLLNVTDGGYGGITWIGEHHNKGKKLEEIVGEERAIELKKRLSQQAINRVGELNGMYGKRGELSPNYGKTHSEETKELMRKNAIKQFSNYSKKEIDDKIKIMNDAKKIAINNMSDKEKKENNEKESKTKYKNSELFTEEHRKKLRNNNYKKLNKGKDILKLSEETKEKLSKALKGRIVSEETILKLRRCIKFEEFEEIIFNLINSNVIKNITQYRNYVKNNKELKLPSKPEESYKKYGWISWKKYFNK